MQVRRLVGALLIAVVTVAALLSFVWTPYDPTAVDIAARLQPPSVAHLLGTDAYGRDVLSILLAGARSALGVALAASLVGFGIGVPLGLWAAARPGPIDAALTRGGDVVFALPPLLLAVLLAAGFGPGVLNAIIAVGIFTVPIAARLTRNTARGQWSRDYILAARLAGRSSFAISRDHILPNILRLLAVQAAIQLSVAVLADAALSYVGLGVQPPAPSWGRMIADAQTLIAVAPWLSLFPGLAITATVFGFGLLADGIGAHRSAPVEGR